MRSEAERLYRVGWTASGRVQFADEFIIARNGRPVARLVALAPQADRTRRIGVAKGRFEVPDDIDESNENIRQLFEGA